MLWYLKANDCTNSHPFIHLHAILHIGLLHFTKRYKMLSRDCFMSKCLDTALHLCSYNEKTESTEQTSVVQSCQSGLALNKQCTNCNHFWGENGAVVSLRAYLSPRSQLLACVCVPIEDSGDSLVLQHNGHLSSTLWWCYSNSVPSEEHPHSLSPSVAVTPYCYASPRKEPGAGARLWPVPFHRTDCPSKSFAAVVLRAEAWDHFNQQPAPSIFLPPHAFPSWRELLKQGYRQRMSWEQRRDRTGLRGFLDSITGSLLRQTEH